MIASTKQATLAAVLWPDRAGSVTRHVMLALAGSALLWISAKIQVPFWPVPMTMQSLVVLVIGAAFGWRLGLAAVMLYLIEGAAGLPVFAGTPEKGIGLAYMAGPTAGYLAGFLLGVAAIGVLAERGWDRTIGSMFVAMSIGHALILLAGWAWLATLIGPSKAWVAGVEPFYAATLVKTGLAALALPAAWRVMRR